MDLKIKSTQELKALAYDLLVQQEIVAMNLQAVNSEINERSKAEAEARKHITDSAES